MKVIAEKRLFWFLKEGTEIDLSNNTNLDMYVQQSLSAGKTSDVKKLLTIISLSDFIDSFTRVKDFLPDAVKRFWEEWLADTNRPPKKDT
jgi:hypothetical protein